PSGPRGRAELGPGTKRLVTGPLGPRAARGTRRTRSAVAFRAPGPASVAATVAESWRQFHRSPSCGGPAGWPAGSVPVVARGRGSAAPDATLHVLREHVRPAVDRRARLERAEPRRARRVRDDRYREARPVEPR